MAQNEISKLTAEFGKVSPAWRTSANKAADVQGGTPEFTALDAIQGALADKQHALARRIWRQPVESLHDVFAYLDIAIEFTDYRRKGAHVSVNGGSQDDVAVAHLFRALLALREQRQ